MFTVLVLSSHSAAACVEQQEDEEERQQGHERWGAYGNNITYTYYGIITLLFKCKTDFFIAFSHFIYPQIGLAPENVLKVRLSFNIHHIIMWAGTIAGVCNECKMQQAIVPVCWGVGARERRKFDWGAARPAAKAICRLKFAEGGAYVGTLKHTKLIIAMIVITSLHSVSPPLVDPGQSLEKMPCDALRDLWGCLMGFSLLKVGT